MWTQFSLFFSLYISGDLLSIWSFWVFTQWKCSRPACYSFDTVLFSFSYWRVTFFWHVEKENILKGSLSFSRKYKNERHSFMLVWLNQFQYKKLLIWFRISGNTSDEHFLITAWPHPEAIKSWLEEMTTIQQEKMVSWGCLRICVQRKTFWPLSI